MPIDWRGMIGLGQAGRMRLGSGKPNEKMQNSKKESHSGQNPKCLPQKRLFQSPKYRILLMRMRRKTMEKKEQQIAMMRSLRSATATMGMTVADVSPAKSGNLPCDVTLSQGPVLA